LPIIIIIGVGFYNEKNSGAGGGGQISTSENQKQNF
jgi:hypothetical protein